MPDAPIVIEPPAAADASVIWLHGLGADGHDFEPVVSQLQAAVTQSTRFVFPHAPMQPVTINGGMLMRAWYDILDMQIERRVDAEGVTRSAAIVDQLISAQRSAGIEAKRIVLAGFSQGGAIALHVGLRHTDRLAGIMALSTYLAVREALTEEISAANRDVPIFLAHGSQDPVVPLSASEDSRVLLRSLGYSVQCNTYPMPHSVCAEELRDISCWLEDVLAR
jgi:phospholipase/carboxylesterase